MASPTESPTRYRRQSHSFARLPRRNTLDSTGSNASYVSEVEMAHDEVFAGPMSESVPTSVASFSHRRARQDSTTSFTFFQEQDETPEYPDEEAIEEYPEEVFEFGDNDELAVRDEDQYSDADDRDLELGGVLPPRRKSSALSRTSIDEPLLGRHESYRSASVSRAHEGRQNQKLYIETEDLEIVIAGFSTSVLGFGLYATLCILTLGLGYLLSRWLPKWKVKLIGTPRSLRHCSWVVIENGWGEFQIQSVVNQQYGRALSTVFARNEKESSYEFNDQDDPVLNTLRFLDYRYIRFFFHPLKDKFVLGNSWRDPHWTDVKSLRMGLDSEERNYREQVFGSNMIEVEEKSIVQLLLDEAFHPFYVFQIASLILWTLDEYYYYAACIFVISVFSITTTLIETRSTMRRLREISRFECDCRVLRSGFWRSILSSELVPGDVYEVSDPSLSLLPCDSLLLAGDCIINESMLTGESVPVSKTPATDESLRLLDLSATSVHPDVAKNFLYCGTKIIRAKRPQDNSDDEAAALAVVVRTGFNTTKGALVRSMLFPKPSGFKFYRDSFRYITVMAGIAFLGFIASFVNFVRLGLAWHLIIIRALDLITIVVPPALPATLSIGTNFALGRLRKQQIFCISPQRVNVGGKLDVVCFDKTGTLTEDGLDVLGVRVVQGPDMRFSDILPEASTLLPGAAYERDPTVDYEKHRHILYTMATCHSLRMVDDELIGDPLDLKMFQFTGWSYDEGDSGITSFNENGRDTFTPSVARPPGGMEFEIGDDESEGTDSPIELGVLRAFEFVSQLRRASVIVRRFNASGGDVYVKGAPECMRDICIAESIPKDYDDLLHYYTHRGFRVIGCATKRIPKLNWVKIQKTSRADAESGLTFLGFIIFENKLKPKTTEVIDELNKASIRNVMCTGDNILTAISVARECNLMDRTMHCYVPYFAEGHSLDPDARLLWESIDNPVYQLDEHTLLPDPPSSELDLSIPYDAFNRHNFSIAISGDVFRWVIDYGSEEILKRMLVCGQVFARMSPDEKHELVEKLQSLDYCCGFCGDGANDCGALKAADVGISLSEAEASVAAPFTSRVFDITCVPKLIAEGRAALVTSFCCFKYMSLYSAIQFTSVSFLYASASNLGDFQFLFIDLVLILPIAIFMGWTGAYPTLSRKRPTARLVSRKVLVPLLGQIVLCILTQLAAYETVRMQPWYKRPKLDLDDTNIKNSENTALFLVSCYQYILSGVVLSVGPPFRSSMTANVPFVVTIVVTLLIASYMLFDPALWLYHLMQLTKMSMGYKAWLFALAGGAFGLAYVAERQMFPTLARVLGRLMRRMEPKMSKDRKQYKVLLDNL